MTELLSLLGVSDNQGIQVLGTTKLELNVLVSVLLDAGRSSILSASDLQELLNVTDLTRLKHALVDGHS